MRQKKNNAYFLGSMNSKYLRLEFLKVTDQEGTTTDKKSIMEKVKNIYQKLFKKKTLNTDYKEFLSNNPKISEASKESMKADLTQEEIHNACKEI